MQIQNKKNTSRSTTHTRTHTLQCKKDKKQIRKQRAQLQLGRELKLDVSERTPPSNLNLNLEWGCVNVWPSYCRCLSTMCIFCVHSLCLDCSVREAGTQAVVWCFSLMNKWMSKWAGRSVMRSKHSLITSLWISASTRTDSQLWHLRQAARRRAHLIGCLCSSRQTPPISDCSLFTASRPCLN